MNVGEKYLPLGTVVMLKGGTKRIMIIGYCPITEDKQTYDYMACLFPEGVLSPKDSLLFNHDQIVQVFYNGLIDAEQMAFVAKVKQIMQSEVAAEEPVSAPNDDFKIEPTLVAEEPAVTPAAPITNLVNNNEEPAIQSDSSIPVFPESIVENPNLINLDEINQ